MIEPNAKEPYAAPSLQKQGRVENVTAGNSTGSSTDAAFVAGQNFDIVTFS